VPPGARSAYPPCYATAADNDSLYLQFKPTTGALNYPRKHISCTGSHLERHFPIPLHYTEHQFY